MEVAVTRIAAVMAVVTKVETTAGTSRGSKIRIPGHFPSQLRYRHLQEGEDKVPSYLQQFGEAVIGCAW